MKNKTKIKIMEWLVTIFVIIVIGLMILGPYLYFTE